MRIVDRSPYPTAPDKINLLDRAIYSLRFGLSWFTEVRAQAKAIDIFRKLLDNQYTLVHNLSLPGQEALIPLVLVGPGGVSVYGVTGLSGIFRARGEAWSSVDSQRHYRPAKPNLITQTAQMAKSVEGYLRRCDVGGLSVEPVLLCIDPGTHVESIRPITRVVLSDAVERFVVGQAQAEKTLSPAQVDEVVELLSNPVARPASQPSQNRPAVAKEPSFFDQIHMSREQVIILGVLGGLAALVLIGLLVFFLFLS
jgi:hypothetical protein